MINTNDKASLPRKYHQENISLEANPYRSQVVEKKIRKLGLKQIEYPHASERL
jgi:hypothetical protein